MFRFFGGMYSSKLVCVKPVLAVSVMAVLELKLGAE
jgi:hypothetical protein